MTIYKLKKSPKEGEIRKEGNYTYKFIAGRWRKTHYKDLNGYEYNIDYDEMGNETHYKNSENYERWYDYDNKGNMIHYQNSDRIKVWYDEKGNEISKEEFEKIWEKVK